MAISTFAAATFLCLSAATAMAAGPGSAPTGGNVDAKFNSVMLTDDGSSGLLLAPTFGGMQNTKIDSACDLNALINGGPASAVDCPLSIDDYLFVNGDTNPLALLALTNASSGIGIAGISTNTTAGLGGYFQGNIGIQAIRDGATGAAARFEDAPSGTISEVKVLDGGSGIGIEVDTGNSYTKGIDVSSTRAGSTAGTFVGNLVGVSGTGNGAGGYGVSGSSSGDNGKGVVGSTTGNFSAGVFGYVTGAGATNSTGVTGQVFVGAPASAQAGSFVNASSSLSAKLGTNTDALAAWGPSDMWGAIRNSSLTNGGEVRVEDTQGFTVTVPTAPVRFKVDGATGAISNPVASEPMKINDVDGFTVLNGSGANAFNLSRYGVLEMGLTGLGSFPYGIFNIQAPVGVTIRPGTGAVDTAPYGSGNLSVIASSGGILQNHGGNLFTGGGKLDGGDLYLKRGDTDGNGIDDAPAGGNLHLEGNIVNDSPANFNSGEVTVNDPQGFTVKSTYDAIEAYPTNGMVFYGYNYDGSDGMYVGTYHDNATGITADSNYPGGTAFYGYGGSRVLAGQSNVTGGMAVDVFGDSIGVMGATRSTGTAVYGLATYSSSGGTFPGGGVGGRFEAYKGVGLIGNAIAGGQGADFYYRTSSGSAIKVNEVQLSSPTYSMNASGPVIIGATAPSYNNNNLDIKSDTNYNLRLEGANAYSSGGKLNFGDGNYTYIQEATDDNLTIYGSGGVFLTGGNVGVGTTAPGAKLDVSGSIRSTSAITGNSIGDFYEKTGSAYAPRTATNVCHMEPWWGTTPNTVCAMYVSCNAGDIVVSVMPGTVSSIPAALDWSYLAAGGVGTNQGYIVFKSSNIANAPLSATARATCFSPDG